MANSTFENPGSLSIHGGQASQLQIPGQIHYRHFPSVPGYITGKQSPKLPLSTRIHYRSTITDTSLVYPDTLQAKSSLKHLCVNGYNSAKTIDDTTPLLPDTFGKQSRTLPHYTQIHCW